MPYASTDELHRRLGPVYQDLYAADDSETPLADLEAGAAEIDGMIGTRYEIPVTGSAAAALLKNWNLTLAEELAWARSGKEETPQNVQERVKTVREYLEKISAGAMLLAGGVQSAAAGGGSVVCIDGDEPIFGRRKMKGY